MNVKQFIAGAFAALLALMILWSCSKNEDTEISHRVNSIKINSTNIEIALGDSTTLTVQHLPADLTTPNYSWKSSDPTVATVTNGKIKTLKVGVATISAEVPNTTLKSEITITVKAVSANNLTLSTDKSTINIGEKTILTFQILPINTTDKDNLILEWSSSNSSVATVVNGEITGIAAGTVEITAQIKNTNITAKQNITVNAIAVSSITLNQSSGTLLVGQNTTLTSTVLPTNASNKNVTWSSSNTNIATVDNTGKITAIAIGAATITATTENGNKTASYTLTVSPITVSSVSLNPTSGTLNVGATFQLNPTINPSNATNKTITYSSSNVSVASVSSTGIVTAKTVGNATITVKTGDGGKTATYNVTVNAIPVESLVVNLNPDNITLGQTSQATATVSPSNATDKSITWASSNASIATVSNTGVVTSKSTGTVTITATTSNGKTHSAQLLIKPISISSISLNKARLDLLANENYSLTATITPSNANSSDLYWESTAPSVAIVNQNGQITTVGYGSTTIRVRASQGSNIYKECVVNVLRPEEAFELVQTRGTTELVGNDITHLVTKVRINNKSSRDIAYVSYEVKDANGSNRGTDQTSRTISAGGYTEVDFKLINWNMTTTMSVKIRYNGTDYIIPIVLKKL